jgi:hypothetical protein
VKIRAGIALFLFKQILLFCFSGFFRLLLFLAVMIMGHVIHKMYKMLSRGLKNEKVNIQNTFVANPFPNIG